MSGQTVVWVGTSITAVQSVCISIKHNYKESKINTSIAKFKKKGKRMQKSLKSIQQNRFDFQVLRPSIKYKWGAAEGRETHLRCGRERWAGSVSLLVWMSSISAGRLKSEVTAHRWCWRRRRGRDFLPLPGEGVAFQNFLPGVREVNEADKAHPLWTSSVVQRRLNVNHRPFILFKKFDISQNTKWIYFKLNMKSDVLSFHLTPAKVRCICTDTRAYLNCEQVH